MAVNPYQSPLYARMQKTKNREFVKNYYVLLNICKYFTNWYDFIDLDDTYGYIRINKQFYITNEKTNMRMISRLDWVHYNPIDLAHAIETDTVEIYYANQLGDPNSHPNIWKDTQEEFNLKTYYATRVGRLLDQIDNL